MKRIAAVSLISISMLVLFSATIAAQGNQAPISGTWECQAKGGTQGDTPFTLYLEQDGENVRGSVSSPMGGTQISSGSFKDNTLEIHIDADDANYVLAAKLDKGTLSGTWASASGNDKGTWQGKKQAAGSK